MLSKISCCDKLCCYQSFSALPAKNYAFPPHLMADDLPEGLSVSGVTSAMSEQELPAAGGPLLLLPTPL